MDSAVEFQRVCDALDAGYVTIDVEGVRAGAMVTAAPAVPKEPDEQHILRTRLAEFRAHHKALAAERDANAAEAARLAGDVASLATALNEAKCALDAERRRYLTHFHALQREHDELQGSLRTFMRGYLPLLRRHLFGR